MSMFILFRLLFYFVSPVSLTTLYESTSQFPSGLEASVQRCLCAASRTTFGGDVFFIVRDLFGGDGVVVAPLSVKRARGPVLSALDQHEDKGGREGSGESPVEIAVRGGAGASNGGGGASGVVSIVVTSRTAYGLYADELVSGGGGGSGGRIASSPSVQQQEQQRRRPRRRSLSHPMITLHATLVETIPVLITNASASGDDPLQLQQPPQPELRVLARGLGAGRLLKLRAERPPSPCPSPPPIFAVYHEDAAAAGGGGPMRPPSPPRSLSPPPPPPPRENDEISV